jgi:ABC-type phosphate transport system substrate-binding protein
MTAGLITGASAAHRVASAAVVRRLADAVRGDDAAAMNLRLCCASLLACVLAAAEDPAAALATARAEMIAADASVHAAQALPRTTLEERQARADQVRDGNARFAAAHLRGIAAYAALRDAEAQALSPADLPQLRALGLTAATWPRVDGSTTCRPLLTLIAARALGAGLRWQAEPVPELRGMAAVERYWDVQQDPMLTPDDPLWQVAQIRPRAVGDDPALLAAIDDRLAATTGTGRAWKRLIAGEVDLILVARGMSASERAAATEAQVEPDARPFARDALVPLVHWMHPDGDVPSAFLRRVFTAAHHGQPIDLTGAPAFFAREGVTPFSRERDSGSRELFETLVAGGVLPDDAQRDATKPLVAVTMSGPFLALTRATNGLSYTVRYYAYWMAGAPAVRMASADGIAATPEHIASGRYPYRTDVLAVVRGNLPADHPARRLRDWLLSAEGRQAVVASGNIPLP